MATTPITYIEAGTGAVGDAHNLYAVPTVRIPEDFLDGSDAQISGEGQTLANVQDALGRIIVLVPIAVEGVSTVDEAEATLALTLDGSDCEVVR